MFTAILVIATTALLFGGILGSLAACMGTRIPYGKSTWGRSHCLYCNHTLSARDLIPVVSYLILKGRCRHCNNKIKSIYLMPEITLAFMSVLLIFLLGPTPYYLQYLTLLVLISIAAVSDLETTDIPDRIVIAIFALGTLSLLLQLTDLFYAFLGAVLGFISITLPGLITKKHFGGGDIKLITATGLILGPYGILFTQLVAAIVAIVHQKFYLRTPNKQEFPFGPYLYLGAITVVAFQAYFFVF